MCKILKEYENKNFSPAYTDPDYFERLHEQYHYLKMYYSGKIGLDQLYQCCGGNCLLNSCHWCNDNCDKCDIEGNCKECYKRCINQK